MGLLSRSSVAAYILLAVVSVLAGWGEGARGREKAKAPPAKKLDDHAALELIEDYWVEVKVIRAGKQVDSCEFRGWSFVRDNPGVWPLAGEIGEGDKGGVSWSVNTKHDPMWLEIGTTTKAEGIFKFEGDTLVWVTRTDFPRSPGDAAADPGRPATFESNKENGWTVRYMKRTDGFWGWKPKAKR